MDHHPLPKAPVADSQGESPATELPPKKNGFIGDLLDYLGIIVLAICLVLSLFSFSGLRLCTVDGASMENTLYHQERLVTWGLFYTPERNDIVVFHQTSESGSRFDEPIVKRVIGVPGDTVHINYLTWTVSVTDSEGNVTVLDEPYRKVVDYNPYGGAVATYYVEEGTVFVMGDNRNHSADSRDPDIGLVDQRRILGKVILRLTPISRFGAVS